MVNQQLTQPLVNQMRPETENNLSVRLAEHDAAERKQAASFPMRPVCV